MKRFTETTKWADPWFMDLPVKYKAFWFYICDQCDCAGFWEPNMRLAIAQIGEPMELAEILRVFLGRIEQQPDGKLWIIKFISFQYGILSRECKPHLAVIKRLESSGILDDKPKKKGYPKGIHTLEEKEKVQEKEKDRPDVEEIKSFCQSLGLPVTDGEAMFLHWQEKKWPKNWQLTIRKWKSFGYLPSQKQRGTQPLVTMTKYGVPLPRGCTIRRDGEVLDYTGRIMDINQVRHANQ